MTRVVCKFPAGPEVVFWGHGRKTKDNVMISGMLLYLIMFNLLKESYVLHAIFFFPGLSRYLGSPVDPSIADELIHPCCPVRRVVLFQTHLCHVSLACRGAK